MDALPRHWLIDRMRYPIDDLGNPLRAAAVDAASAALAEDGCAVLPGFFNGQGLAKMLEEAEARKRHAYYSDCKYSNVYLGDGNPERSADHPQNVFLPRNNGFMLADAYGDETASRQLFFWPPLKDFIADCLGKDELFIYEDPIANMIVNVNGPGQQFNWHFDTNEFTITMLLQAAESGGVFEYVPNLRKPTDECYADVKQVLAGDRSRVKRLQLNPGDLQLFLGRFSLHRVTENTGTKDRLLLIMSFAERPGMLGNRVRVMNLYGRTTAAHDKSSGRSVRADTLLD